MALSPCLAGSVLALSATLLAMPDASAQTKPSPSGAGAAVESKREGYALQVVAVDVASVLTGVLIGATLDADAAHRPADLGITAATWYGLGAVAAPAVHYAHGNAGIGGASLGMRLFIPPLVSLFGFVGVCTSRGEFEADCRQDGLTGGALVGMLGVAALDAAVFADPRPRVKREEHWYGWKLLTLDGAALLAGAYVAANPPRADNGERLDRQTALWVPPYLIGLFGGPIIHATHGQWLRALGSFGLRGVVGPMAALPGLLGYCSTTGGVDDCTSTGAQFGLVAGLLAVDLFDALVMAREEVERGEGSAFMPTLSAGPGFIAVSGALP
jgi:hypothetical protein